MIDWIADLIESFIKWCAKWLTYLWQGIFDTSLSLVDSIMPKLISLGILVIIFIVAYDFIFED